MKKKKKRKNEASQGGENITQKCLENNNHHGLTIVDLTSVTLKKKKEKVKCCFGSLEGEESSGKESREE